MKDIDLVLEAQKHQNEKQKIYLVTTIIIIIILAITAIILLMLSKKRKRLNDLLRQNNKLIELQRTELKEKNDELEEINNSKDKLFSIVAHDLKNPFNVLLNYTKILKEEYHELSDEEIEEYITNLNEATNNTYELLENLLFLSASRTGKLNTILVILKLKN